MWSRRDLNRRPLLRPFIAKLSADLATNCFKIKAAVLQRASSPDIRPDWKVTPREQRRFAIPRTMALVSFGRSSPAPDLKSPSLCFSRSQQ